MSNIAIVGTGYVADLYMRSLKSFPRINIINAFDSDRDRLNAFCRYWGVLPASSLEDAIAESSRKIDLVLNLTNPAAHYSVSKLCLEAERPVYSEKPLATTMGEAFDLHALSKTKRLIIASAPCSFLGRAAQTAWRALRDGEIGKPLLVYAELDDDFVSQAPYKKWISESGAPWPYRDEFKVGCTLEHAGYYLTWLMAMFGTIKTVVACATEVVSDKLPDAEACAPDYSSATLMFESGVVARLTCSIVAPHDHSLRIFGERGVLEVRECWSNAAAVRIRRRHVIRRRLINSPFSRSVRLPEPTHPMVGRLGAASMNFALGPVEVLAAIKEGRASRLNADLALHLNEVTLAIQNPGPAREQTMLTTCPRIEPMPWAKGDNEASVVP